MAFDFGSKYISNEEVLEYINSGEMHPTVLSFVDPNTQFHHLLPVWTIFYNEKFYFSTDDFTKKYKVIEKQPTKIGLSIMDRDSYPIAKYGVIPYFYASGTATIRRKEEFQDYTKVIAALYDKFDNAFPTRESKEKWITDLMTTMESRVLIEMIPEKIGVYDKNAKFYAEHPERIPKSEN